MRLLRRILATAAITLGVIALVAYWIAPVALSFDMAKKSPPRARVAPTDLKDLSLSQISGTKLSYFGYEFEIPWTDLDETKTRLVPEDHPEMVGLVFRSGVHLIVSAIPARVFPSAFAREWKVSPQSLESVFGHGAMQSDYSFRQNLYQFTPDKMHFWALSPTVHYREQFLLTLKATVLSGFSADTGIFNVRNNGWYGFQLGDPQAHPRNVNLHLFSEEGSIEFTFAVSDPRNPAAVTQPEINRIVESLRKVPQNELAAPQTSRN